MTSDGGEVQVRLTLNDELSPKLREIQSEFGELLETRYDWRIPVGAFAGSFIGALMALIAVLGS